MDKFEMQRTNDRLDRIQDLARCLYSAQKHSWVDMSRPANTFGGPFYNLSDDIRFYDVQEYIEYLQNNP